MRINKLSPPLKKSKIKKTFKSPLNIRKIGPQKNDCLSCKYREKGRGFTIETSSPKTPCVDYKLDSDWGSSHYETIYGLEKRDLRRIDGLSNLMVHLFEKVEKKAKKKENCIEATIVATILDTGKNFSVKTRKWEREPKYSFEFKELKFEK